MKKFSLPLILVCITALLATLAYYKKPASLIGQEAPPFRLKLLNGGQLDSNDLKGKSVLLYFFASW